MPARALVARELRHGDPCAVLGSVRDWLPFTRRLINRAGLCQTPQTDLCWTHFSGAHSKQKRHPRILDWQVQPNAGKCARPRQPTLFMTLTAFVGGQSIGAAVTHKQARSCGATLTGSARLVCGARVLLGGKAFG